MTEKGVVLWFVLVFVAGFPESAELFAQKAYPDVNTDPRSEARTDLQTKMQPEVRIGAQAVALTEWQPETQTLFAAESIRHGGFGAPVFGVTAVNGQAAFLRGIRGAWVINMDNRRALHVGLASYRTASDFEARGWPSSAMDAPELRTRYGGFELEYVHRPGRLLQLSGQVLTGGGTVRYREEPDDVDRTRDNYFVIQPAVNGVLNITGWFRLSGSVGYRYADGVNLSGTGSGDLSGPVTFFALRFGRF